MAVLAFAGVGSAFMQTVLIPIQAELPALLRAERGDTAWVITITLLVSAVFTPISGKLGDMFGKRRVVLVLLGLILTGSVVAALSTSLAPLLVGRALQGSGAGVIPLGISILRDELPRRRLGGAIALVSATLGVGGALGLPFSAVVVERFDWHVLFWVSAAITATSLSLVVAVIPKDRLRAPGRIDVVGALGLAVVLSALVLVISRGNEWGWTSPIVVGLVALAVVVLLAWSWYELRVVNPVVDLRVSARRPVLLTNVASVAMGFALFASIVAFPQLLALPTAAGGLGLSLLAAGLALMPAGLAMMAMAPVAGRVERTMGPKPLLVAGALTLVLAYGLAVLLDLGVWHIVVLNTVIGVGIGLGYAAMPALIMQAVPASESGAANGLNTLMRALGTAVAAAAIGAVLAQYSVRVDGLPVPTAGGFQSAFLLGLAAAAACAAVAAFIPRPHAPDGEEPALPQGAL